MKDDPELVIRRAVPPDAAVISNIHIESRAEAMPWLPVIHSPEAVREYFEETVLPNQIVYVACLSGTVVGFVAVMGDWINHLYIAPAFWRNGFGVRLVTVARQDKEQIQLWTFQENLKARAFYQRLGFKEAEFTNGEKNEEKVPDVRLIWRCT